MKTLFLNKKYYSPKYYILDAQNNILGRFATKISNLLQGKNQLEFSKSVNKTNFVIVINADQIKVTGKKYENKNYYRNSQRPGSLKVETYKNLVKRLPKRILEKAVFGMLPKTILGRQYFKNLYILNNNELNDFLKKNHLIH
jgi:large subunit ribosomal protein L13